MPPFAAASTRHRFATLASAALVAGLAAMPALAGRVVERPGVERAPAFVCISTTIRADGNTRQSRLFRRSGNPASDRIALRYARALHFMQEEGVPPRERVGHLLFRLHANLTYAFRFFEEGEPLPEICHSPFESVAKDAEINARFVEGERQRSRTLKQ